jgi:hypothetical protein
MYPYEMPPNDVPEGYELQAGDEIELLTEVEHAVWDLAHSQLQTHARLGFTRQVLADLTRTDPSLAGEDPDPIIDKLLGLGDGPRARSERRRRAAPLARRGARPGRGRHS